MRNEVVVRKENEQPQHNQCQRSRPQGFGEKWVNENCDPAGAKNS